MKRWDRIGPAIAGAVLTVATLLVVTAVRRANRALEALPSLAGGCSERLLASSPSPDGEHVAAVFVRGCRATASFATHVNLRASSHAFAVNRDGTIDDGEVF